MEIGIACSEIIQCKRNTVILQAVTEADKIGIRFQKSTFRKFHDHTSLWKSIGYRRLFDLIQHITFQYLNIGYIDGYSEIRNYFLNSAACSHSLMKYPSAYRNDKSAFFK